MSSLTTFIHQSPVQRLIGPMPKIGIRPAIDGRRRGVRESMEEQTMKMAHSVARLITESLRHYNGLPVECVVAEHCIGGVAEAAQAAAHFAAQNVGASITVTPSWCYGSETMDMDPVIPKAVWGFNGTERPGAVYLAAVSAAHNQKGLPTFKIYGHDVQDLGDNQIPDDVRESLLAFARSALAAAEMRGKSYLSLGGMSMGIAGSLVDHDLFEKYLGMRVEVVDMSEFVRRFEAQIYDPDEFEHAMNWVRQYCPEGTDINQPGKQRTRQQKDQDWARSVQMALITRDLMIGNPKLEALGYAEEALGRNAIAAGFQGQRQWTDHFPNGDFMEAILNSSFDWHGIRAPYIVATENDALNAISMLFGHLLTGTAQVFADVRTYWSPHAVERVTGFKPDGLAANGFIHLINSGAAALDGTGRQSNAGNPAIKPFWMVDAEEAAACLQATTWCPAELDYFRGGGYSSSFSTLGGMPVTMTRLNLVHGLGPVLQIAEGTTLELPDSVHAALTRRTSPTWPTTWFVPRLTGTGAFTDVYSVMDRWGANHGSFCYGHIGADLITLASILRIPVNMHNVAHGQIIRPSVWPAFGTADPEGADYRACHNFGPLYGKYK